MTENLEKQLYLIDPVFFEEAIACINKEMNSMDTCMAFGCECGDGWFEPLKLFVQKTHILNDIGKNYNIKFVCNQLKEKFGTLRVYSSTKKIEDEKDFKSGFEVLEKMFDDALKQCEDDCLHVCEKCGADGGLNNENIIETSGWISYICKKCAREITENETKRYDENHKENNEFYGIDRITLFKQENKFLNLYHQYPFEYKDVVYGSILHAYFSIIDFNNKEIYNCISQAKHPNVSMIIEEIAKKGGYHITDFNLLKEIVKAKFSHKWNETIRRDLLLTKTKMLINMNNRHDNILGYCYCKECKNIEKQNILGKILMEVRNELMNNIEENFLNLNDALDFRDSINENLHIYEAINEKLPSLKKYIVSSKPNFTKDEWMIIHLQKD